MHLGRWHAHSGMWGQLPLSCPPSSSVSSAPLLSQCPSRFLKAVLKGHTFLYFFSPPPYDKNSRRCFCKAHDQWVFKKLKQMCTVLKHVCMGFNFCLHPNKLISELHFFMNLLTRPCISPFDRVGSNHFSQGWGWSPIMPVLDLNFQGRPEFPGHKVTREEVGTPTFSPDHQRVNTRAGTKMQGGALKQNVCAISRRAWLC